MIDAREVSVALGAATIVDRVSLAVEEGSWVTVIGPNGAGKTTLLRAVAGLTAYRGELTVGGEDVRAMGPRERARRLALVAQRPVVPADMTVREYVLLGRTAHLGYLGRSGAADRRAAEAAVGRLALGTLADRRLATLSGGERQRAVVARALAQEAPVLILDEPTAALDIGRQQEALDLVAELRAELGLTVLGAMHDLTLAGQYADELVLLDAGRVAGRGPARELLGEPLVARHYRVRVRVTELAGAGVVVVPERPTEVRAKRGLDF